MYTSFLIKDSKSTKALNKINYTGDYLNRPFIRDVPSYAPEKNGANEMINDGIKICVMEPDSQRIDEMYNLFQSMGHEVLFLNHVIGASNEIRCFAPDLLLLDLNMPTISGDKLIKVLKENLKNLPPTILYTKMEEDKLKAIAKSSTVDNYVVKKEDYINIVSKIKSMMARNFEKSSITAGLEMPC